MATQTKEGLNTALTRRLVGPLCISLGLFLILASFSGSWGMAYGQTVVTPTPSPLLADPVFSKTVDPSCGTPGDPVVFTITVINRGTADATNVVLQDTIPPELILVEVTTTKGTVTISGNSFEVVIGTLAPGEIVTIVVQTVISEDAPVGSKVTNMAYMNSDEGDREASVGLIVREVCETPNVLPPTGGAVPESEGGTSLWLLVAGLLLLLLGTGLSLRGRTRSSR